MKSKFQFRIRLLFLLVVAAALVLAVNLYVIQIVKGETYKEKAERQYVSPKEAIFDRGKIYFSDKDGAVVSAAAIKTGFTLAISPKKLANPEDVTKNFASLISKTAFNFL